MKRNVVRARRRGIGLGEWQERILQVRQLRIDVFGYDAGAGDREAVRRWARQRRGR